MISCSYYPGDCEDNPIGKDANPLDQKNWPVDLGSLVLSTGFPSVEDVKFKATPVCQEGSTFKEVARGGNRKVLKSYQFRRYQCTTCGFKVRVLRVFPADDENRRAYIKYWIQAKGDHGGATA